jgi:hypothetical protein
MEIQVAGESPRYDCTVCNAKFDHNLKFPHLVGQKHRLNVLVSSSSSCFDMCLTKQEDVIHAYQNSVLKTIL